MIFRQHVFYKKNAKAYLDFLYKFYLIFLFWKYLVSFSTIRSHKIPFLLSPQETLRWYLFSAVE